MDDCSLPSSLVRGKEGHSKHIMLPWARPGLVCLIPRGLEKWDTDTRFCRGRPVVHPIVSDGNVSGCLLWWFVSWV